MHTDLPNIIEWFESFGDWAGHLDWLAFEMDDLAHGPAPLDTDSLGPARLLPAYVSLGCWRYTAHLAQIAQDLLVLPDDLEIARTFIPQRGIVRQWAQADAGQEPPRPTRPVRTSRTARLGEQLLGWSDAVQSWHEWLDAGDAPVLVHDLRATALSICLATWVPAHQRAFDRLTVAADRIAQTASAQLAATMGEAR